MTFFDPTKVDIPFIQYRKILISISTVLIVASIALLATKGLNFGVDFTGGLVLQVEFEKPVDVGDVRASLTKIGQGGATIQAFDEKAILLRFQAQDDEVRKAVLAALDSDIGQCKVLRIDTIGPVVGGELRMQAILSLSLALAAILLYMAYRFRFRFGAVAVAALMHDVIIMLGAYSLTGKEISVTFIAAILTIAGYSLNDSIVVLDRVRENWGDVRSKGIAELVNKAINQTLSRTINTSLTTLLPVIAMYIWGGEVISNFAFAFLIGILAGSYSSICIVGALLVVWYQRSPKY